MGGPIHARDKSDRRLTSTYLQPAAWPVRALRGHERSSAMAGMELVLTAAGSGRQPSAPGGHRAGLRVRVSARGTTIPASVSVSDFFGRVCPLVASWSGERPHTSRRISLSARTWDSKAWRPCLVSDSHMVLRASPRLEEHAFDVAM